MPWSTGRIETYRCRRAGRDPGAPAASAARGSDGRSPRRRGRRSPAPAGADVHGGSWCTRVTAATRRRHRGSTRWRRGRMTRRLPWPAPFVARPAAYVRPDGSTGRSGETLAPGAGVSGLVGAAAQDALVADPARDAACIERLEQALGELPRDAEPVAQLGQRDPPALAGQLHHRPLGERDRLCCEGQVAAGADGPAGGDEVGERPLVAGADRRRRERRRREPGVELLGGRRRRLGWRRRAGSGARFGAARRTRGGSGSVTIPPARVIAGPVSRITTRSPGAATARLRSRSCTRPAAPGTSSPPPGIATRAVSSAVPWCTITGSPFRRPRGADSSTRTSHSSR